jgi:hypothetical protein
VLGKGRPIDQRQWPEKRPERTFFELLDSVHGMNGTRSLRTIAAGMNLASRSRVSTLLRGTLPADEDQAERLIRALGGSDADVGRGLSLYQVIRSSSGDQGRRGAGGPGRRPGSARQSANARALRRMAEITTEPPPSDRVASIAIVPAVLDALEAARISCVTAKRKFATPHLLLSILDLPDSKVARCFDQVKPGLAHEWHELLESYQAHAIEDENYDSYRPFDWDNRYEVRRAKEIAWRGGMPVVDELYLLLGILDNHKSKTRRELAEYLGAKGYEHLCQVANRMVEAEDTPGSVAYRSDD